MSGTFTTNGPAALKKAWRAKAATTGVTDSESCPDSGGEITIRALPAEGDTVDGTVADDGSFSLNLDTDKTYYLNFFQGGERCAELEFQETVSTDADAREGNRHSGNYIIGKGSSNVDLGNVYDIGGGHCYAENEVDFDSDEDGIYDEDDDDADNDGEDDYGDCDWDGIRDFADADTGSCDIGECDVIDISPTDGDILWIDVSDDYWGYIQVYLNNTVSGTGVDASAISLLDENGDPVGSGFSQPDWDESTDYFEFALADLDDLTDYTIEIPAGTITCDDGTANESDIDINFFTVYDEDLEDVVDEMAGWDSVDSGTLDSGDSYDADEDFYYEEWELSGMVEGDLLEILLESVDFDTVVYLYYGSELIDWNDDYDDGILDSYIGDYLPYDGTYTVIVAGYDTDETGDYTLSVVNTSY